MPPDAVSYNETQLDLPGLYATVKRMLRSSLPQRQQGGADMLEILVQTRLGMPLTDALALTTGEFSSMQTSPSLDPDKQVYLLGIRQKADTLKLIRTLYGDRLTSERNEGDTTFLKISMQGGQSGTGVAQWSFYHLAVTPDLLLGAGRSETLHALLAQRALPGGAEKYAATMPFHTARAQFPEKLNGFSYFDFQKLDWQALKARWVEEAKTTLEKQNASGDAKTTSTFPSWLQRADPRVFPRHLHSATGASWKDARGLHFDQWLD